MADDRESKPQMDLTVEENGKSAIALAMKAWTIKTEKSEFFICPTPYFDDKEKWSGPYKTLQRATTAIARKLQAEFAERLKRVQG